MSSSQGWVFNNLLFSRAALLLTITRDSCHSCAEDYVPNANRHKQKSHVENVTRMALGEVTRCPNQTGVIVFRHTMTNRYRNTQEQKKKIKQ